MSGRRGAPSGARHEGSARGREPRALLRRASDDEAARGANPRARLRRALGSLAGLVVRLWLATLRYVVDEDPALASAAGRAWVLALWHGQQLPLFGHRRRRRTVALVSLSADGDLLAAALPRFGVDVERGSSSRGGARGLLGIVRRLRAGDDAAFAVDGPRGPRHEPRADAGGRVGAALAAARAGGVVVPYAAACSSSWTLRSWDRFELPRPFCRVAIVLGAPLERGDVDPASLKRALDAATTRARGLLGLGADPTPSDRPSTAADPGLSSAQATGSNAPRAPYERT